MPKLVDHQKRRDAITAIAAKLIANGGIESATFREIARASGYSKGIIEHYFDDKSDLISASLDWANARYYDRADQVTRDKVGLEAIHARLICSLPINSNIRDEWKIRLTFWSMACSDSALQREQARRVEKTTDYFLKDLRQAAKDNQIHLSTPLKPTAQRLVFSITGLSCAAVHNPSTFDEKRLKKEASYLVRELANPT